MKKRMGVFLLLVVASSCLISTADETNKEREPSYWMKQKLKYSQNILSGLTKADFQVIRENAKLMKGLNRIEHFVRRRPQGYRTQLKLFQIANIALIRSSDREDLSAVTLAFNQLTISCVKCHQLLRDTAEK